MRRYYKIGRVVTCTVHTKMIAKWLGKKQNYEGYKYLFFWCKLATLSFNDPLQNTVQISCFIIL